MRVLLDHNLPLVLRTWLVGFDVTSARYAALAEEEDVDLLPLAAAAGFDVLVTGDRRMPFQQNLATLPIALLIIETRRLRADLIRPLLPKIVTALSDLRPRECVYVSAYSP